MGLIKYVMALMNGARLGIAAQSVGVSEAAYREALSYAHDRKQFGKAIIEFPAVAEMIANIKAKLDASRALLYETARFVDMTKILEDIAHQLGYNTFAVDESVVGNVYLITERAPCPSCESVIAQFKEMYKKAIEGR